MPATAKRRGPHPPGVDLIGAAVEAFVRAFCFCRSFTHPYLYQRVGRLWVTRDAPRTRRSETPRVEEWIGVGVDPAEHDRVARKHFRGRYAISSIIAAGEDQTPTRSDFRSLGYRLRTTEPLMIHRLDRIPRPPEPLRIVRVATQELADRLAKTAGRAQILPEHLAAGDSAPLRQYAALDAEGTPVSWARSVVVPELNATWVSNMHTQPAFRRRGIARALLARMLRDDRQSGARFSTLLASHTGAKLYEALGYEQIGTLLLYTPSRRPN